MCKVVKMTYEIMNCFKMRNKKKKRLEVLQRGGKKKFSKGLILLQLRLSYLLILTIQILFV